MFSEILQNWGPLVATLEEQEKDSNLHCSYQQAQAPTGNVTLVFTGTSLLEISINTLDIQGSTGLWEWNAQVMRDALLIHNDIIRNSYRLFSGYEVKTEGYFLQHLSC